MYWHINHVRLTLPVKQETELVLPGLLSLALSEIYKSPDFASEARVLTWLASILAQPAGNSAYLAVTMENFGCLEKND